jgi:hypothetical protein
MAIEFACPCGRRVRAPDDFAGKYARCPACQAVNRVPEADDEDVELEIVEEKSPPPTGGVTRRPASKSRPRLNDEDVDDERERPRKNSGKKKRRPVYVPNADDASGRAVFLRSESVGDMRIREEREYRKSRSKWSVGGGGLTMAGVHITGGVIGGMAAVIFGLMGLALCGLIFARGYLVPRLIIGSLVLTIGGAVVVVRAIVYGEES